MRNLLLATAAVGALALTAPAANATPTLISIAIGSSPMTVATDTLTPGSASFDQQVGLNTAYDITANGFPSLGFPQPNLDTTSINVSTFANTATLTVWVTETGLSSPLGVSPFKSGFTSNTWDNAVTSVVETTFVDTSNATYGTGTQLATTTFTAESQALNVTTNSPSLSSPFSETVKYVITFGDCATSAGCTANDTIDLSSSPVPEPTSLALLGVGLLGVGFVAKRKRSV